MEYKINKINKLKKGDAMSIIGLASPMHCEDKTSMIEYYKKEMLKFDIIPIVDKTCFTQNFYETATKEERACAFNNALKDDNVKAIMSLRGGFSSVKILDLLDESLLQNNKKPIIGYSDITVLLNYIAFKYDTVTFHGPMFANREKRAYDSFYELFKLLDCDVNGYTYEPQDTKVIVNGLAKGRLMGGNMSMVCSIIGTKYELDVTNKILFLEEINEAPYRIDKMLTQLKMCGYFDKASAVVFGSFAKCTLYNTDTKKGVYEIIQDVLGDIKKPVLFNFPSGHESFMYTLPIGAMCEIHNDTLKICEDIFF